jgi:hypothetical protein
MEISCVLVYVIKCRADFCLLPPQEDAILKLMKAGSGSGGFLGGILSKGHKFSGLDVKRVYFG